MIDLTADLIIEDSRVRIEYTVRNTGREPVFVFTLPTEADGTPREESADAILVPDTRVLRISLAQPPLPPNREVYTKVLPLSRRLTPVEEHSGRIVLPLPVREYHPYAGKDEGEGELVDVEELLLMTQYVREVDAFFAREIEPLPGYFRANGHPAPRVEISLIPDAPLNAIRRQDEFFRF